LALKMHYVKKSDNFNFDNLYKNEGKCMKLNALFALVAFFGAVLFSYSTVNAQSEEKTKDAVTKTKDVAVQSVKKTSVVVTDMLTDSADKTKNMASGVGASVVTKTQKIGNATISVTDNVTGQAYEGGKWFMVSTWDGAKWVSKREWFPNKKQ